MGFKIGLAGPGKVGKSTTARKLVEAFTKLYPTVSITRYAFAQPLYEVASLLSDIPVETLKNEEYKETPWNDETKPIDPLIGWTPRKFLQVIGTECFRNNVSQNFWIDITLKKIKSFDFAIIEDARFVNEFQVCDVVLELERDGVIYAKNHASAMPPPEEYIWRKIPLTRNMSYEDIASDIYRKAFNLV